MNADNHISVVDQDQMLMAQGIIDWLSSCQLKDSGYDRGGIFDPLDKRVIGDHYAATHFAWACAVLFEKTQSPEWMERSKKAIEFHLRTSPDEYPPGKWDYHWDFNNLAFIETYILLQPYLSDAEKQNWKEALFSWKTNNHSAVNWLAMRALALYRRGSTFNCPEDIEDAKQRLDKILSIQKEDGGFDDIPNESRPSQYHAYTACLIHQMRYADLKRISSAVVRAARWLLTVTSPDGDMNALGRGQGQIFGYVCAIYLFKAASGLDKKFAPQYQWAAGLIVSRLRSFVSPEGWLPLVLNKLPVAERAGWYDYHHLTVYNAFSAVWLLLSIDIKAENKVIKPPFPETLFLSDSGILSVRKNTSFSLWASGESGCGYAVDTGITPHLLYFDGIPIFRYPVGPGPGKYGRNVKEHQQAVNIWSPLIKDKNGRWVAPFGGKGSVKYAGKQQWLLTYQKEGISWVRRLIIGRYVIEARDRLELPDTMQYTKVRASNVVIKPEHAKKAGRNSFLMENGPGIKLWGEGGDAEYREKITAANGRVQIIAVEKARTGGSHMYRGGWRIRKSPGKKSTDLPGILCLSWDPWSVVWKRKQRLLFEMAGKGRAGNVLYAEPPVSGTRIVEGYRHFLKDGETGKCFRRAATGRIHHAGENFYLFTPVLPLPGQRTFPQIHSINQRFLMMEIRRKLKKLKLDGYVLWLYHPSQIEFLDELGGRAELIVFDWTDDWAAAFPSHRPESERRKIEADQDALLKRVDVVFGVSEALCRRAKAYCPWVYHLPNATNPDVFRPPGPEQSLHPIYKGLERPYLVYLSQITDRLDFNLVAGIARRHPDWQIILIGPVVCPESLISPLRQFPNISLPGKLPYAEAARAVSQGDVCILPHKVDALTSTLDPIKLYDYLATGVPVVSTDVAMHPDLRSHIRVVKNMDEFESAVLDSLNEHGTAAFKRRQAALEHVWEERAEKALDLLGRFFT